jgi:tetratricopeptide (TPR) repeat protein
LATLPARARNGIGLVRGLLLAGLVFGPLLGGVCLLFLLYSVGGTSRTQPALAEQDTDERLREIREAFGPGGPGGPAIPAELAEELHGAFRDMGQALRDRDAAGLERLWDAERLLEHLRTIPDLPRAVKQAEFARGVRKGFGTSLVAQADLLQWQGVEIRNVKVVGADDVVATARHRQQDGTSTHFRWWLVRRPGGWRFYDFEDLDASNRFTTLIGLLARDHLNRDSLRGVTLLREAHLAIAREDYDTGERKLAEAARERLPGPMEPTRLLLVGVTQLRRGKCQEGLETYDRLEKLNPDMPILGLLRGAAHNGLGQWEQALPHLKAFRELFGEEATVLGQIGLSLRGLERFPEAAEAYRKALDDNPKDAEAFLGLLSSLSQDAARDDIPARFKRLENHREAFLHCAPEFTNPPDAVTVNQLAEIMRKLDPDFAAVDSYQALARVQEDQFDAAGKLFQTSLNKEKDAATRKTWTRDFLWALADKGRYQFAYSVAPDPREGFSLLVEHALRTNRKWNLDALVKEHAQRHPTDPLLPLCRAEVDVLHGRDARADKEFTARLARPAEGVDPALFRQARVLARYRLGRAESAIQEIGPREETFTQLAELMLQDRALNELAALLEAHAKAAPASPVLSWYRCRLEARQGNPATATKLFREGLAGLADPEREARVRTFLDDMIESGKHLDAYPAVPDPKAAFGRLVSDLALEEKAEDLARLIDLHRARYPNDLQLYRARAGLLRLRDDRAGAAEEELAGWEKAPEEQRERDRYRVVEALYRDGLVATAYEKIEPRGAVFPQLAQLLRQDGRLAELERLLAAQRFHEGNSVELLVEEALFELKRERPKRAVELFRQAQQAAGKKGLEEDDAEAFLEAVCEVGWALEAYRAATKKEFAFQVLSRVLLQAKRTANLLDLLDEHARAVPADPNLFAVRGELYLLRGDLTQADQHFRAGLKKGEGGNPWRCQEGSRQVLIRKGQTVTAYRQAGANPEAFGRLAEVCLREKASAELAALIAAHRAGHPEDESLPGWEVEAALLNKDPAGALKVLTAHRETLQEDSRFRGRYADVLVRCLVQAGRPEEALRELNGSSPGMRRGDPLLRILCHAARGDAEQTQTVLAGQRGKKFLVERCYRDADLGPLLRGEKFAGFRARFPPPR